MSKISPFKNGLIANYFIAAFRASMRDKTNFVLTIVGLSIGMAASLLIALYALHESTYDDFQPDAENTYRVLQHHLPTGNNHPLTTPRADQRLKKIHGVEDVFQLVRSLWSADSRVQVGNEFFKLEKSFSASKNILDFIKIKTLYGNLSVALSEPNKIALAKSEALRLFGKLDIIGKSLIRDGVESWTVEAVFDDLPSNSHFAINSLIATNERSMSIIGSHAFTYVRLNQQADRTFISQSITQIFGDLWGWNMAELQFQLQPLLAIHLDPNIRHDMKIGGSAKTVFITSVLSLLLLIISSFNYINMSIAQGGRRAKEVAVRKVLGAGRFKLIAQFLGESIVIALFCGLLAASMVELVLPWFNQLVGRELAIINWSEILLPVTVVTLLVGIFSGLYPAIFISSFNARRVLSGDLQRGKSAIKLRKILMVFQSALSVGLIVGAISLYQQLNLLQNLPVNYEKTNRLRIIDAPMDKIYDVDGESFYQSLTKIDGVISATPIDFDLTKDFYAGVNNISIAGLQPFSDGVGYGGVGYNAAKTLGLQLVAGRDFSEAFVSDWFNSETKTLSIMLPESILNSAGYRNAEQAIGKIWQFSAGRYQNISGKIVGVFKDIKIGSVRNGHTPVMLGCGLTWSSVYSLLLEVDANNITQIRQQVSEFVKQRLKIEPVEIQSLEANYLALYDEDERLANTVAIFSALAVFLTCVGMFGLAAYSAQRRNREVAVRKVLGASRFSLVSLLAKESMLLIFISLLIAFPTAFYLINNWLSYFNQRIDQSPLVYLLASLLVASITWLTVWSIALHTAGVRPAEVLRSE